MRPQGHHNPLASLGNYAEGAMTRAPVARQCAETDTTAAPCSDLHHAAAAAAQHAYKQQRRGDGSCTNAQNCLESRNTGAAASGQWLGQDTIDVAPGMGQAGAAGSRSSETSATRGDRGSSPGPTDALPELQPAISAPSECSCCRELREETMRLRNVLAEMKTLLQYCSQLTSHVIMDMWQIV